MALPDIIEIVPLDKPVKAEITVPGSKSITNRALILAALADGDVTLKGALWSEDTQIMVACLKQLGFIVNVSPDADEPCNRTIMVIGQGGLIPPGGTEAEPMQLFVGNAGTAARFLVPFLCLGSGAYRLHGTPRMHERPQAALFAAVRELNFRIESEKENEMLPVRIFAGTVGLSPESQTEFIQRKSAPVLPKMCHVSIAESSQFASALLLSSKVGAWDVEIEGENAEESPYVAMTTKLMEVFPMKGGTFQIEPDASSGSYFWGANTILPKDDSKFREMKKGVEERLQKSAPDHPGYQLLEEATKVAGEIDKANEIIRNGISRITVGHWPDSHWQIDAEFPNFFRGVSTVSRIRDLGDSIMTAIVLAPLAVEPVQFTDLGRLRVQECERVVALRTELTKCGVKVVEEGDTLTVYPAKPEELRGAEIETYNDHRMAMCFAILGLKVPGIRIKNPACVKKTFPNFFQKLAALPPQGLGAEIWEVKNGWRVRKLSGADLFAD